MSARTNSRDKPHLYTMTVRGGRCWVARSQAGLIGSCSCRLGTRGGDWLAIRYAVMLMRERGGYYSRSDAFFAERRHRL